MIKTKKIKTASKKIVAMLLSLLTVLSCFCSIPFGAQAAEGKKITYSGHELHYYDGKEAYCIDYGTWSSDSFTQSINNDSKAVKYWNNKKYVSEGEKKKINNILRSASALGYVNSGEKAKFGAVQKAIWEAMGHKTTWNATVNSYYNTLKNATKSWKKENLKKPSFAGDTEKLSITKTDKDGNPTEYGITLEDDNENLSSYWTVDKDGGLTVSNSGNKLKVSSKTKFSDKKTVTLESEYGICKKITDDNVHYYSGIMGAQVVLVPSQSKITTTVKFKINPDIDPAAIRLYKRDAVTGERLEGVHFTCTGKDGTVYPADEIENGGYDSVTNENGKIEWTELPINNQPYTVTETVPDGYSAAVTSQTVSGLKAGEHKKIATTADDLWWDNTPLYGALEISKSFEGLQGYAGATFELTDDEHTFSGTTDANG